MQPGQEYFSSACRTVTCSPSNGPEVGDPTCVANADCVPDGDSFACQCAEGFVGDSEVACRPGNSCLYTFIAGEGEVVMQVSLLQRIVITTLDINHILTI